MPSCCWHLPDDRPRRAGDGPVPWPGSLPGPWFLARVLPEAQCQGWTKAISEGNAKRPNGIRVPLRHFRASNTEPLTCLFARQDPRQDPSDSPAFTPLTPAALGPL